MYHYIIAFDENDVEFISMHPLHINEQILVAGNLYRITMIRHVVAVWRGEDRKIESITTAHIQVHVQKD